MSCSIVLLVGMHGSFVVCQNRVEKLISFDHGLAGSITEDTYFAFLARTHQVKFHWIDGVMYEQSPFTILDFMKQRARWLAGLVRVCVEPKIPIKYRYLLWLFTLIWLTLPLSLVLYFALSLLPIPQAPWFMTCMVLIRILACWNYVLGFVMSCQVQKLGFVKYAIYLYLQILLQPYFGLMESCAVAYAVWNYRSVLGGFHVVQKEKEHQGIEDKQVLFDS
jgi:beta-1,4-mannosyltransferase